MIHRKAAVFLGLWLATAAWGEESKSYEQIITREARTSKGVFQVHRVKEKLYYEIPKAQLNRPFLMVTQAARVRYNAGYGGDAIDHRVVRWELRDQKVYLRGVSYDI